MRIVKNDWRSCLQELVLIIIIMIIIIKAPELQSTTEVNREDVSKSTDH
jgi:hypothetical protein